MGIRWTKLLVNSTFSGMSAALGCTYGDILDNPKALECVAHIANECLAVVRALGVKPEPMQGVDVGILAFQNRQQMKKSFMLYQMAFSPHRALKASMLQDLEKGLHCEINTINGKVAEMGRKAGVATPVNDKVVEIVKTCEEDKLKPEMANLDFFVLPEVPEAPVEATAAKQVVTEGEGARPARIKIPNHKRIITCAITGSIHTPTMSEHLPITPDQNALDAANAGAAVVHIHARNPADGMPVADLKIFDDIINKIREKNKDLIICITTGGGAGMTVEQRASVIPRFKPELASCNLGSMNWSVFSLAEKFTEFKYPWEGAMMELPKGYVFQNTFSDLFKITSIMVENGTKPEFEVYDIGPPLQLRISPDGGPRQASCLSPVCYRNPRRYPIDPLRSRQPQHDSGSGLRPGQLPVVRHRRGAQRIPRLHSGTVFGKPRPRRHGGQPLREARRLGEE